MLTMRQRYDAYNIRRKVVNQHACAASQVDDLAAPVPGTNASATLQDVCYKPLGDDCATQSILQVMNNPLSARRAPGRTIRPKASFLPMKAIDSGNKARSKREIGMRPACQSCVCTEAEPCGRDRCAAVHARLQRVSCRCATCSVCWRAQYWKMDLGIYEHGAPPYGTRLTPDFCFGHWQTQCRATYEAPVDPHVVLGGFPAGAAFRNFSADATSLVVTYPVASSADNRCTPPRLSPRAPILWGALLRVGVCRANIVHLRHERPAWYTLCWQGGRCHYSTDVSLASPYRRFSLPTPAL